MDNKEKLSSVDNTEESKLEAHDPNIERSVPLSHADLMGFAFLTDESVVLELGYLKNTKKKEIIIDVRKKLPPHIVRELYEQLKYAFETDDERITEE